MSPHYLTVWKRLHYCFLAGQVGSEDVVEYCRSIKQMTMAAFSGRMPLL